MAIKDTKLPTRVSLPETEQPSKNWLHGMWRTLGGWFVRVSDEPGKESIQFGAPTGTSTTIYPDGTRVDLHNGKSSVIYKGGVAISSDENYDVKVTGHGNIQIGGGVHVEIVGDASIAVSGGNAVLAVPDGNLTVASKNIYLGATGNFSIRSEGNFHVDAGGQSIITSDGNMSLGTKGSMTRAADGTVTDKGSTIHHNSPGASTGSQVVSGSRPTTTPSSSFT